MAFFNRVFAWLLLGLLAVSGTALAQEPADPPDVDVPEPDRPAVLAVLETKPATPREWVKAAHVLARLRRPDLAKQFLGRVIEAKLDDKQLVALADDLGSSLFSDLAARRELQPEGRQVADAVLGATVRARRSPDRLNGLIAQLGEPSPDAQARAFAGLKEAGPPAVLALIETLRDPGRRRLHPYARQALVQMGREALGPLLATLDAADPALAAQAIRVLGVMKTREAAPWLLRPCTSAESDPAVRAAAAAALKHILGHLPGREQSVELLSERAEAYFYGHQPIRPDTDGQVTVWRWDPQQKVPISRVVAPDDARRARAARLANDAFTLAPDDPEVRRLYLTTLLEQAAYETGLGKPLTPGEHPAADEAGRFAPAALEDVLENAMASGHPAAATAAARLLGHVGTPEGLLSDGGRPTALARALRHPDRRLRMAAAEAVVRLKPERPFAGASYLVPALAFSAGTSGERRALLAGPGSQQARELAGELAQLDYDPGTATTGRGVLELAARSPDYELALIDPSIGRPEIYLLLQRLRRDPRTADLRVGLITRRGHLARAEELAARDPLVLALSRPHDDEAVAWQVERLGTLAPRAFVPFEERKQQAAAALDLLLELSGRERSPFDLRKVEPALLRALYVPALSVKAAKILATINSARSQRTLVEAVSRWTLPLGTRAAALEAFGQSTRRHGILLTSDEILLQYERYNQSESLDRRTQAMLGLILDYVEAPTRPPPEEKPEAKPEQEPGEEAGAAK